MDEIKQIREKQAADNEAAGIKCDVEFQMLVERAK
jgi:kinesin family protein 2/24